MGVAVDRECSGERDLDGNNVARTAPPRWLSLAMDSQLGGADRHQHVALFIVRTVNPGSDAGSSQRSVYSSRSIAG